MPVDWVLIAKNGVLSSSVLSPKNAVSWKVVSSVTPSRSSGGGVMLSKKSPKRAGG